MDDDITGMYELLDAIEGVIKAADPAKREAHARTIDAWANDFPEDFLWAVGPQAPTLLNHILSTIESGVPPRGAIEAAWRYPAGGPQAGGRRLARVTPGAQALRPRYHQVGVDGFDDRGLGARAAHQPWN